MFPTSITYLWSFVTSISVAVSKIMVVTIKVFDYKVVFFYLSLVSELYFSETKKKKFGWDPDSHFLTVEFYLREFLIVCLFIEGL